MNNAFPSPRAAATSRRLWTILLMGVAAFAAPFPVALAQNGGDSLVGLYQITASANPGSNRPAYTGSVNITRRGSDGTYGVKWSLPQQNFQGVGLRAGEVFGVAYGEGTYGVTVYRVLDGGRLEGVWTSSKFAGGEQGAEALEGATTGSQPGGEYRIVDGRNPGGGPAYQGKVTITPNGAGRFTVQWAIPGQDHQGVALLSGDGRLLVASWATRAAGVVCYEVTGAGGNTLEGRWVAPGVKGIGREDLKRTP